MVLSTGSNSCFIFVFFFNDTATTEIYTLSLHDALPISAASVSRMCGWATRNSQPACRRDRKSTRLNSSHSQISYAVFCLNKKKNKTKGKPTLEECARKAARRHTPLPR